jgi:DNA-binding CsgD family transcriptional regulator
MPPMTVLTFLLAMAVGLVSLALVSRRSQQYFSPVAEALVPPLLFYNLWVLVWLIFHYLEANVLGGMPPGQGRILLAGLVCVSMATAIQWGSSYLAFTVCTAHAVHPQGRLRDIHRAASVLTLSVAGICMVLLVLRLDHSIRILGRGLGLLTFLSVAGISLRFFLGTYRMEEAASKRLRLLAAVHALLLVALAGFVGWYRLFALIPRNAFITINVGMEILYNLATVFWIHRFDRASPIPLPTAAETAPLRIPSRSLAEACGISKREEEVIHLVCQGLTNQEIADRLFISLKTVKDHNYRIFQKTGVRNRVELTQWARNQTAAETEAEAPGIPTFRPGIAAN